MARVGPMLRGRVFLPLTLMLSPCVAQAQRVALLDFSGDRDGRVREQVQTGLLQTCQVKLVSRDDLERAVEQHNGYLGWNLTVTDVRGVARRLGVGTIVTATVAEDLDLRLFDASGENLWGKHLPLQDGRISPDHLRRLSAAIVVASKVGRKRPGGVAIRGPQTLLGAVDENGLEMDTQRQTAISEIAASREAARKRREEALMLEQRARATEWVEAERTLAQKREARIQKRLQEAAAHYEAEMARHKADLEHNRELSARRRAEAMRRKEEASRRLDALAVEGDRQSPKPSPPPAASLVPEAELAKVAPAAAGAR